MKIRKYLLTILFLISSQLSFSQMEGSENPEEEGENRFLREEWFYKQRAIPFDEIPENARLIAYEQDLALSRRYNKNILKTTYPAWLNIGPAPAATMSYSPLWGDIAGRMRSVAVDPLNPDIIYIGAANGGVWKTTNGGNSWFPLTENELSLAMGAIAIDPNNPDVIYAGTGEALAGTNRTTYFGAGLLKSTNGGMSWQRITNGFGSNTHFSKIAIRSSNSNYVYAALATGLWYASSPTNQGIWRSTNGGINWTRTLNVTRAFDVIIHPVGQDTVYAAVGNTSSSSGFYKSTDAGQSWIQQNTGLISASSIRRMHISQSQNNPSIIYAVTNSSDSTRVFKSTNGGNSWFRVGGNYWFGGIWGSTYYDQGWYDLYIAVNPSNPDVVYVGNVDLMKTTDGGNTWTRLVSSWDGKAHVDQHSIAFHPYNHETIFIVNDGGINKSTNGGNTFTSLNTNLSVTQFYHIATSPHDVWHVIGGTQDNATQRRPPGSTNWVGVIGGDGGVVVFDYSNPSYIYGEYVYGSIYRSSDGGNNFYSAKNGITESGAWIAPILIHPDEPTTLYTATTKIYKTTNRGDLWFPISDALYGSTKINAMDISRTNPDYMLALASEYSSSPAVFISSNGGYNWSNITSGLPARYMTTVKFHPDSSNIIFVGISGFGTGHLYRSTNYGTNWTNISTTLPDIPVNDIFIDPTIPNLRYFIATDLGVYVTENAGNSWVKLDQEFPNTAAMSFSYHKTTKTLRVATHGRGIFEMVVPDIPGSISGRKYLDIEQDSSITANPGLTGWVIKLFKDGNLIERTITDENGYFVFNSVPPATYTIEESLKSGWTQTFPRVNSDGVTLLTYGENAGQRAYMVELHSNENISNINFGNFQLYSISGKIFFDVEKDSLVDNNPPLENWVVKLYKDGVLEQRTETNSEGEYIFQNLNLGIYTVEESLKLDWIQTYPRTNQPNVTTTVFGNNAGPRAYYVTLDSNKSIENLDFGNYTTSLINYQKLFSEGWNLISIGLQLLNWNKDSVFHRSASELYSYKNRYVIEKELKSGYGYWIKYSEFDTVNIKGFSIQSDTIDIYSGWNLIGSIFDTVSVSSITTIPENLISSNFFGYRSGYYISDYIVPFDGYWVKSRGDGKLVLQKSNYQNKKMSLENYEDLNEINFSNGLVKQKLFFGDVKGKYFDELPPIPPEGCFDVRFANGKFVEMVQDKVQIPILIQSTDRYLNIDWQIKDGKSYKFWTQTGEEIILKGKGSYRLKNSSLIFLSKEKETLPEEFELYQNYPNPFNPSTEIKYSLPAMSIVTIKVYDILGKEIATLFEGVQDGGYHSLRWIPRNNGTDLSSGVYYYSIKCIDQQNTNRIYNRTRKMIYYK
ncbi:MAG: Glycosyl hydrolase, BNR repeat precursor [Ignavibacteriae bacterium]|nr:MAG: Glycosyl hydrolase, BNR repeat precursor [Ignavibacteriota bacterium]